MNKKVILVWFRNDLRTSDNEVLYSAIEKSDFVIPVYIFDPRYYTTNRYGFENTGALRRQFILNSVAALKSKLQKLGGDLLTFEGYPEEIIPRLVQKYDVDEVYHHREVARRETRISELVEESLWLVKRNLKHFIGHTLYHKEDLPFPIKDIPDDYNTFKKKVSKESFVRESIPDVTHVAIPPHVERTPFDVEVDEENLYLYGEGWAKQRMEELITQAELTQDLFSELSPYLSLGILSPAQVYHFFHKHLTSTKKKVVTSVLEGLLWRDYYRFMLKKYPNCFFKTVEERKPDKESFDAFVQGKTAESDINELVQRLNDTGMLNRLEKELVAMYFVYERKLPWRYGASFFEQQLIDYAPATNYGFWSHIVGRGTSLKHNRNEDDWLKMKKALEQVNS